MPGEVPEHLLRRSAERRRALGLPVPGDEGADRASRWAAHRCMFRTSEPKVTAVSSVLMSAQALAAVGR